MLGLAPWRQVQIEVVAEGCGCHHRILLVLAGKLGKRVIGLAVYDGALLNPAHFVLLRAHPEEAAAVFEHIELLAVDHLGHAIGNCGHAIMEVHLPGRDVNSLLLLILKSGTATCGQEGTKDDPRNYGGPEAPGGRDDKNLKWRVHSLWRSSSG